MISPKSLKVEGEGNTNKSSSPSPKSMFKFWCCTYFEDDNFIVNTFKDWIKKKSKYYIIGYETCPTTSKKHLQVFFEYNTKRGISFDSLKRQWPKTHFEPCKGNLESNLKYCSKEGEFETNIKTIKLITPDRFYPWQTELINIINNEPDDRIIHWYWDSNGNSGKTAIAKYICFHFKALCISGKSNDCKNAIVQYFNKNNEYPEIIILDIPRSNLDFISYEAIESIKNGLFYSGKYEGGMVIMNPPHMICFANEEPNTPKLSIDRWCIHCLSP